MKKVFSTIITLLLLINLSSSVTVLADTALNDDISNASSTESTVDTNDAYNTTNNTNAVTTSSNSGTEISKDILAAISSGVSYNAHVSKVGWQNSVFNGDVAGTTGRSLPIEALKINLPKINGLNLNYQAHVSKIGWQDPVSNGEIAGSTGKSLPIEAIKISLSGLKGYSIQYQAHIKNIGWQNWVSDGEIAGSTGKSLPIEAIRIRIVKTIHPESFNINKNSISLAVGDSEVLSPSFTPSNTTNEAVTWKSSNENVATVDDFGKIKAIAPGNAVITSTSHDGNLTASCNVTVYSVQLQGISLNKSTDTIYVGSTDKLQPIFTPNNATNKKVSWTSSDTSIATVDGNGVIKGIKEGTVIIKAVSEDGGYESTCTVTVKAYHPSLTYQTHCQRIGWQKTVKNGEQAGTTGKGLRMEAIKMNLSDVPKNTTINYQVYVQNKGWTNIKKNGETAGYVGAALRLEAVRINLSNLPGYSIQYRTYVQTKGWMPWVTNGNISGTLGRSLKIEAIQIKLVKSVDITYNTYQQKRGWTGTVHNNEISSTNGQPLRIEAFSVKLNNAPENASIQYQAHVQGIGWQNFVSDGQQAGTTGKGLRIEAINAKLVNLPGYTLQYQVFIQNKGWTNWTNGGQVAGTIGKGLRIQGIRMRVIEKPDTTLMQEIYQSSYAVTLANYLNNTFNIQSVNNTAVALHGGITSNNCVFFSSEALRRTGIYVPISMCNTGNYTSYLSKIGFVRNYEIDNLAIGDICFSVNGSYGYPTHTYVFMGWVNPDDHTQAYVADNQAGFIHIRSMIQSTEHDAFAYSMHK